MKTLFLNSTIWLFFAISLQARQTYDKMAFAVEMVRHGARAPLKQEYAINFTVSEGMLTAQGMRQRYLLGRY